MTKVSSAVMFPIAATATTSGQLRCVGGESTATELQCGELTATEESVGSSSLLVSKQLSPILTARSSQLFGVNSTISRSRSRGRGRGRGRRSSSDSSSSSSYSPPYANSIPSPSLSSSSSSSRLFGSSSDEEWDCLDSSSATSSPYTSEEEEEEEEEKEEAVTPRAKEYRIPELLFCPPAPRKPRIGDRNRICGGATTNAGGSFFAVPDLDHTFLTMRAPAFV